ncbi:MAG: SpoIIE family protein phosphatase [Pelosinus sp.]|nr:SpoIIE family protein phosphatase [Pelosinus sp.]
MDVLKWIVLYGQYVVIALGVLLVGLMIYRYYLSIEPKKIPVIEIGEENAIGSRETQEDAGGATETEWGTLAVVADGLGKGHAGKNAALIAVRTFLRLFISQDLTENVKYFFNQAFTQSNREILERLQGARGGTAVAAALINCGSLYYASVGDVKIALLRDKELVPVNEGHTMKSAAVKGFSSGLLSREQALAISQTDRQSNFVGRDGFKNIEIGKEPISLFPGDIIIVMTDGIYKCFSWVELESILNRPKSPQHLAEEIIDEFKQKPVQDKDNASLFVLRYNGV